MNIKEKLKSVFNSVSKSKTDRNTKRKNKSDSELSADDVTREEVFPKKSVCSKKTAKTSATKKPASKRTRPTNNNYEMIDPDDNTCDSSKS